jgi:predicted membrane protein
MRKLFITLAIIFGVLGILFTALRMDSITFLPVGLSIILSVLAYFNSAKEKRKLPIILLIIGIACLLITIGEIVFVKDEVAKDSQFEKVKVESKKEDLKDLQELEDLK